MWDMRYNAIYGYVICYKGKAKKSFRSYAEAQKYLKSKKEAKVARKTTKKRKLSGNALKQKAYALIKKGAMKLVRAKGRGRKVNTRYAGKERVGVYIYKLKSRKK